MDHSENTSSLRRGISLLRIACVLISILLTIPAIAASNGSGLQSSRDGEAMPVMRPPVNREAVRQGIRVELDVVPVPLGGVSPAEVYEGDLALITLKLSDAVSGAPVTALYPKVWLDLRKQFKGEKKGQPAISCSDKVRSYLQGTLSFRPDVDLNGYYILTLNNDATIGVIDPIRGVAGYSQLLAMIALARPGEDWVYSRDGKTLFVTMPKAGKVAVIDTENFKVQKNIDAGSSPSRIALQPDGKYLWVGNNAAGDTSGVTVLNAGSGAFVARFSTGAGHHELAFSEDSAYAFVSNRESGSVSIIDIQSMKKIKDLATGKQPVSMVFSRLGKSLYVAHEGDGAVVIIDGKSLDMTGRIPLEAGLKTLRFAPGDRWGFVVNSRTRRLSVFDVSSNSVTYTGEVGNEPEHIAFSSQFAYIRSKKTAEVTLIALANLGKGDKMTPLRISGGGIAPGESTIQPSMADNIVVTPEGNAVLIASPADSTVVYYMEGMGVPAGSFRTYGRTPRALSIVTRQLRESDPGTYSSTFRVPAGGRYDAAVLLDSPRIVHCFEFDAAANPLVSKHNTAHTVEIDFLDRGIRLTADISRKLRFRLKDSSNGQFLPGIRDLTVLVSLSPAGAWRKTSRALSLGDGSYEIDFRPPRAGNYTLFFEIPSLQVKINQLQPLDLHVQQLDK